MGRPPKPTKLKMLHGDRRDRINRSEPQPAVMEVVAPEWLPVSAREIWDQFAPDLIAKSLITSWDVEAFGAWCDAADRRRRAVAKLASEGEIVDLPVFGKNGELTGHRRAKNPWLLVLDGADAQLVRYGGRFGMTPADRTSLVVGGSDDEPGADLLSG